MPVDPQPAVFLSYPAKQRPVAKRFAAELEQRGIGTVTAPHPSEPQLLAERLDRSEGYVVLVDPAAPPSQAQQDEWFAILNAASGLTKPLVPVLLGPGEPPPFLQNWEAVRLPADRNRWGRTIDRVAAAFLSPKHPRAKSIPASLLRARERRFTEIARVAGNLILNE